MKPITFLVLFCLGLSSCQNADNLNGQNETVNSEDLKTRIGKKDYTLIYFWTTWCGPCRKALKETLPQLEKSFDASKAQLLIVAVSKDDEKIQNILSGSELKSKKYKLNFMGPDVYLNHKLALKNALEDIFINQKVWQNSVPVFALVDEKGKVINPHLPKDLNKLLAILKQMGIEKKLPDPALANK